MLQIYYIGLGLIAGAATAAWLFRGERINVTSFVAFASWTILAVQGGSVEHATGCCSTTAASVPIEIRGVLLALGLLSLFALILHQLGVYPPVTDQAFMQGSDQNNA